MAIASSRAWELKEPYPDLNFKVTSAEQALAKAYKNCQRWALVRNMQQYPGVPGLCQTAHVVLFFDSSIAFVAQHGMGNKQTKHFTGSLASQALTQYLVDGRAWISGPLRTCKVDEHNVVARVGFVGDRTDFDKLSAANTGGTQEQDIFLAWRPLTDTEWPAPHFQHDFYSTVGKVKGKVEGAIDMMLPVAKFDPRFSDAELMEAAAKWPRGQVHPDWPKQYEELADKYSYPGRLYGMNLTAPLPYEERSAHMFGDLIRVSGV